jgi:hypothetical protein
VTAGWFQLFGFTTELKLGVHDRLDLGVAVPFLRIDFNTTPVDTVDSRSGLGDVVLSAQALLVRTARLALSARLEAKLPTGTFDPSVFTAPITEGQLDITPLLSMGASLYPYGYANLEVGVRCFRPRGIRLTP